MYVTAYMSRAQKFETKAKTDDRGEIKLEIKSSFDTVTLGLSRTQAREVVARLDAELLDTSNGAAPEPQDVPF